MARLAIVLLALAALTSACSGGGGRTASAAEQTATLEVRQVQTELGYSEGSIGVLLVHRGDGRPAGPAQVSGEPSRIGRSYESGFPSLDLPPGEYVVELWQQPCAGTCPSDEEILAASDPPDDQLDGCATRVTLAAGETRRITATWAPGQGCASFE